MTPESLAQLNNWVHQINFLILPAMGWSILDIGLAAFASRRLNQVSGWALLACLAWVDWKVALAAYLLFLLGDLVFSAINGSLDREIEDAIDQSTWNDWRKGISTPIFLSLFFVMLLWMPHAWALPLIGVLIGVPLLIVLLVTSIAFRAGVLATVGVLTVLGLCHGVLHLVH